MVIINAKYSKHSLTGENCSIQATIDGIVCNVPLTEDNRHYAEILKQVADGDITIAEAD